MKNNTEIIDQKPYDHQEETIKSDDYYIENLFEHRRIKDARRKDLSLPSGCSSLEFSSRPSEETICTFNGSYATGSVPTEFRPEEAENLIQKQKRESCWSKFLCCRSTKNPEKSL